MVGGSAGTVNGAAAGRAGLARAGETRTLFRLHEDAEDVTMRWFSVMALVAAMGGVAVGARAEETSPATGGETRNPAVLVKAGEVDEALVMRLRDWAQDQLALSLPLAESIEPGPVTDLNRVADLAAPRVGPDDLGVIVLFASTNDVPHHGVYRPEQRVVVINVNAMREGAGADPEVLARRLERQVIRGVCTLLGLDQSPNPQSAYSPYSTLEQLDLIGRNLDPPWQQKMQLRARELGLTLDADNPYYMLRE